MFKASSNVWYLHAAGLLIWIAELKRSLLFSDSKWNMTDCAPALCPTIATYVKGRRFIHSAMFHRLFMKTKSKLLEKKLLFQSKIYSKHLGLVATEFFNVFLNPTKTELLVVQALIASHLFTVFAERHKSKYTYQGTVSTGRTFMEFKIFRFKLVYESCATTTQAGSQLLPCLLHHNILSFSFFAFNKQNLPSR